MEQRYKRGDYSPDGAKRFLKYQSYVSKKTGQKTERWIEAERYERYVKETYQRQILQEAQADFIRMQQAKYKKAA